MAGASRNGAARGVAAESDTAGEATGRPLEPARNHVDAAAFAEKLSWHSLKFSVA